MAAPRLQATVNCDMGEGYSLYTIGDDEQLMKTIHLANIACGFHASDFSIMDKTVRLAKENGVRVGAHPSLPDRQGFGRREMAMEPDELTACFVYQVGALCGFLTRYDVPLNHIKPHGSGLRDDGARHRTRARRCVCREDVQSVLHGSGWNMPPTSLRRNGRAFHSRYRYEASRRLAYSELSAFTEWFADLDYDANGKLLITKKHDPVPADKVRERVTTVLETKQVTTVAGLLPLPAGVQNLSICCHSDTPGAVEIARAVKSLVDVHNDTNPS
ncbi:hypothetical protein NM688_g9129 [Phlebia brevispora]|uniref:Uncharacterized protein n=1 Tax=Phlebia brevispora TaxID=194682 RepID=A0ACC1RKK5_9APHY|nr:hypothetical protein NM688_g9129 [Phlebia brevispora]